MGIIRYGRTAQIGVYPGNQSGRFISYRSGRALDPSLVLAYRFAADRTLDSYKGLGPTLICTRSSDATFIDSAGNFQTVGPDVARFTHTLGGGTSLGVQVESSRTNLFLNSGAPATQGITTVAASYAISCYGPGTITVSGSATGVASEGNPLLVTAAAGTMTCTVAGGVTEAQVEQADYPTSYIPTAGATVTRAVESVRNLGGVTQYPNGGPASGYSRHQKPFLDSAVRTDMYNLGAAAVPRVALYTIAGGTQARLQTTPAVGNGGLSAMVGAYAPGVETNIAARLNTNDLQSYFNGTAGPQDTLVDLLTDVDSISIGSALNAAQQWNGTIAELHMYNEPKDNQWLLDASNGLKSLG